jgi:FtsH-binding integral membrane protein
VAELTASMLWAAVALALLAAPAAGALGIDPDREPQRLAFLYGMGLLGTWTALGVNKTLENRTLAKTSRRLVAGAAGAAIGGVGAAFAHALQIQDRAVNPAAFEWTYLGLLFAALAGWHGLSARDRKRRFRLIPIAWTAMLAAALTPLWPYHNADGVVLASMIATTLQIVSPWSAPAARYALYVRSVEKTKRKTMTA